MPRRGNAMIRTEQIAQGRVDGHITHAERPRGGVLMLPTITGVDAQMNDRAADAGGGGLHLAGLESLSGRDAAGRHRGRRSRAPPSSTTARSKRCRPASATCWTRCGCRRWR